METEDEQCVVPTEEEEAKRFACDTIMDIAPYYSHNLKLRLAAQALAHLKLISSDSFVEICERLPLP